MSEERTYSLELTKDEVDILFAFASIGLAVSVGDMPSDFSMRVAASLSHSDAMMTLEAKIAALDRAATH